MVEDVLSFCPTTLGWRLKTQDRILSHIAYIIFQTSNIDIFSKDQIFSCGNISDDENADLCKKRSQVISMQNLSQISGV